MSKRSFGSLFDKNPLLGQAIGVAPLVLFSSTLQSGLVFGVCSFFVLLMTALVVSLLRRVIPRGTAVLVFAVISCGFCVAVETGVRFLLGSTDGVVLWLLPFLACNSVYIYRASDVYARFSFKKSMTDAVKTGGSVVGILAVLSAVREILSYGSVLGFSLFPAEKACTFFALPAGGLLMFGIVCAVYRNARLQSGTEAQKK